MGGIVTRNLIVGVGVCVRVGATTLMVTVRSTVWLSKVITRSVYDRAWLGHSSLEPFGFTGALSNKTRDALVTCHRKVEHRPAVIVFGSATKEIVAGGKLGTGDGLTVGVAVAVRVAVGVGVCSPIVTTACAISPQTLLEFIARTRSV